MYVCSITQITQEFALHVCYMYCIVYGGLSLDFIPIKLFDLICYVFILGDFLQHILANVTAHLHDFNA